MPATNANIDNYSPLRTPGNNVTIPAAAAAVEISLPLGGAGFGGVPVLKQLILSNVTAGATVGTFLLSEGPAGGPYNALVALDINTFALNSRLVFDFPKGWVGQSNGVFALTPSVATIGVWHAIVDGYLS